MVKLPNRMLQYCEHETNVATQFFEADSLEEAFHSDEIRNRVWCAVMHYKLNELIYPKCRKTPYKTKRKPTPLGVGCKR